MSWSRICKNHVLPSWIKISVFERSSKTSPDLFYTFTESRSLRKFINSLAVLRGITTNSPATSITFKIDILNWQQTIVKSIINDPQLSEKVPVSSNNSTVKQIFSERIFIKPFSELFQLKLIEPVYNRLPINTQQHNNYLLKSFVSAYRC